MKRAMLIGLVAFGPIAVRAADSPTPFDAKPGLWEVTTDIGGRAMPTIPQIPAETLARLPPQQRAQIEAMMKGRGGTAGGTKFCMSPDSLKQGAPIGQVDKSCTSKVVSSSATRQQIHLDCVREGVKTTADMTVERVDAEHITANMSMQPSGGAPATTMKASLKWLASDCGDVKPAGAK